MAQHAGVLRQVLLARLFRKEIDIALKLDPRDVQALRDLMEFYLLAPGIAGGDTRKAEAIAQRIAAIDECAGFLARARIAEYRNDQSVEGAMLRRAAAIRPAVYRAQTALAEFYLGIRASRRSLCRSAGPDGCRYRPRASRSLRYSGGNLRRASGYGRAGRRSGGGQASRT